MFLMNHVSLASRLLQLQDCKELSSERQKAGIVVQGKAMPTLQLQQLSESTAVKQEPIELLSCQVAQTIFFLTVSADSFRWLGAMSSTFKRPLEKQAPGERRIRAKQLRLWSDSMRQQCLTAKPGLKCIVKILKGA